jgi:ubiquinone biosynthesis accessory factor UbiJ
MLESPFARALNHLLQAEPWARERLAPFTGETLAVQTPLFAEMRFTIVEGGRLQVAAQDAVPGLTIKLRSGALAAAVRGEEHLLREIDISGNARLASELMLLARHLRWDIEEDLSGVVGDIAARRLTAAAREVAAWHLDAARRLGENLVEYAVEEKGMLARREELAALAAAQAQLRDALDRLEARIVRLAAR